MRWVIADDEQQPLMILKRILIFAGHEVVGEARSGIEAVALCEKHRPDACILDINMPPMMGNDAAVQIQKNKMARHVCIASSNSTPTSFDPLKALGMHVLSKPFQPAQLLKEIEGLK
jgi:DNA-binding NarL/FixJ family response regulator